MAAYQFQVNSPCSKDGIDISPGNYAGEVHRRPSVNHAGGEAVSYTMQVGTAVIQGEAVTAAVKTVDVSDLVEAGTITIIR